MVRQRLAAVAVLAAVPFAVLACSSASDGTGGGPSTAPALATSNSGSTTCTPDSSDETPQSTPRADGSVTGFCKMFADGSNVLTKYSQPDAQMDRGQMRKDVQTVVDAAPSDIKSDVQIIAAADLAVIDGQAGPEKMQTPEVATALQNFGTWMESNCGQ